MQKFKIEKATKKDIPEILAFVDIYLRNDWLVRRPYLISCMNRDAVYMVRNEEGRIVAWATCHEGRLWNLLVHPKYRGCKIGKMLMEELKPTIIRSKSDQSTGDPTSFYEKMGYVVVERKAGRKRNINIMIKKEGEPK
jgi:N-acetylglutamate synthase-like GNAT family acetyltransferase